MTRINAISLFSGMGGDTLGIQNAGGNVVAYNEYDKTAIATHELNFPNCTLIQDETLRHNKRTNIQEICTTIFEKYTGNVDLIFAGFPCQAFSNAGKKRVNDPRNTLFREFVRVTNVVKPKYIIGENVDGLLTKKDENIKLH